MRWFLNDLSLEARFQTQEEFLSAISSLVESRAKSENIRQALYCSRGVMARNVVAGVNIYEALKTLQPFRRSVIISWLANYGPFLDDDRYPEEEDYFEFESIDVTDQGLGEAARRIGSDLKAGVFSFPVAGEPNFERDILTVQHGLSEDVLGRYDVRNVWTTQALEVEVAKALPTPTSWAQLEDLARRTFTHLWFAPDAFQPVNKLAFYPSVSERALTLFAVLDDYAADLQPDGSKGQRANELFETWCTGDYRAFSDEADGNIRKFRADLTFHDPITGSRTAFCPWHGKIKSQQFRFHFECPTAGAGAIRVFYFGPKITKR